MIDPTHVTLREYFEARLSANDTAISAALAAQKELAQGALLSAERAILKAEAATEKRFEGVNEFRSALADQQRTLLPRAEAEVRLKALDDMLAIISRRLSVLEGRSSGVLSGWSLAVGAVGLLSVLVTIFMALSAK